MNTWQLLVKTSSFPRPSVPPWLSANKHFTTIITKRTSRMSIGSQWVRLLIILFIYVLQVFFTVLHPRHKLQYFEKAGWEEGWIKTSRDIVRTEFDQTYAFMDVEEQSDAPPPGPPSVCIIKFIDILDANFFPSASVFLQQHFR